MRKLILVASALAVVGGTASGGEVICGKDWISFEPLEPIAIPASTSVSFKASRGLKGTVS